MPTLKEIRSIIGMGQESIAELLFYRRVSIVFTKIFYHTRLSPDQITVISVFPAILAFFCFITGQIWWIFAGGILIQFSIILDCCDGEVARLRKQFSPIGSYIDPVFDRIVNVFVYLGLGIGLYKIYGEISIFILSFLVFAITFLNHYTWDIVGCDIQKKIHANSQAVDIAQKITRFLQNRLKLNITVKNSYLMIGRFDEHFILFLGIIIFPFTFFSACNSLIISLVLILVASTFLTAVRTILLLRHRIKE